MRTNSNKVIAIVVALVVLGAAPAAHARYGHELDLAVHTRSGWIGAGLASRSDDPSAFVVRRSLGYDHTVAITVRVNKRYELRRDAMFRGCAQADGVQMIYRIDGVDVTSDVTDGGYRMKDLEIGHTDVRVIGWGFTSLARCRIKVSAYGEVHDALTLEVVR